MSAAAMVGVKAYNRSQMSDFALANIEALSQNEAQLGTLRGTCHKISGLCFYVCDSCNQRGEIDKKGPYYIITKDSNVVLTKGWGDFPSLSCWKGQIR